jgi:protein SERAC1
VSVLKADSEVLARIQDSFHTMIRARAQDRFKPIEITCFHEELLLPIMGVVSEALFRIYARSNISRSFYHI